MLKPNIGLVLLLIFNSAFLHAQLIDGNAFLKGKYVEVGMCQCGGWGTTVNAPAGYHARSGVATGSQFLNGYQVQPSDNQANLGFVADPDKDGWDVGSPNKYYGDYFLPRAPWVGWGISFDGHNYTTDRSGSSNTNCSSLSNFNPFPGAMQSLSSDLHQAVWQGTDNGLQLKKIVAVQDSKLYFTIRVEMTNVSTDSIKNIYYGEYVNPDNDAFYMDETNANSDLDTYNTIVFQNQKDHQSLIQAIGPVTGSYLGLGSKDCRAKVFYRINNQEPPTGSAMNWNNSSDLAYSGASGDQNDPIGIVFNIGSLAPNATTSFTYTYILKQTDFDDALGATDPGFSIGDSVYSTGQNAYPCTSPVDITIVNNNNNYGNWVWSPATGLNTTSGEHVVATVQDTAVTYTVTGTGGCGVKILTVILNPLAPKHPAQSIAITAAKNNLCSPEPVTFTATSSGGLVPSYQWVVNRKNVGGDSLSYTYTPAANDTVYCIMSNHHPCVTLPSVASNKVVMRIASDVLYVDSSVTQSGTGASWGAALKTFNEALDWARRCPNVTTINVAKGTYYPTGVQSGADRDSSFAIFRGGLKIYGGYPHGGGNRDVTANPTVLDGNIGANTASDNSYHVMIVAGVDADADSVVIDGFTIQNGNADGAGSFTYENNISINQKGASGLALDNIANNKIVIRHIQFLNNNAGYAGAGLGLGNASAIVENCTFSQNHAGNGGAILSNLNSSLAVYNSTFIANTSTSNGGAIDQDGGKLQLSGNHFDQNIAAAGGAVYTSGLSSFNITNCIFSDNKINDHTAAVLHNMQSPLVIDSTQFNANNGTALLQSGNKLTVSHSFFTGNTSQLNGGAIYQDGGSLTLIKDSLAQNKALSGAALHASGLSALTIDSSAFSGNTVSNDTSGIVYGGQSSVSVTNSIFDSNSGTVLVQSGNSLEVRHNYFTNNSQGNTGVLVSYANTSGITGNIFYKNIARSGAGAMTFSRSDGVGVDTVINNLFIQNNTSGTSKVGGAITDIGGQTSFISNNTFYANTSGAAAGAVYFDGHNTNRIVVNNIFYQSSPVADVALSAGQTMAQQHANVYSTADPLFVDEHNLLNGGLALQQHSPAVNKGDNKYVPSYITTDIAGNRRIVSDIVDIGAYESSYYNVDSIVIYTKDGVPAQVTVNTGVLQMEATVYPLARDQSVVWSIVPVTGNATIDAGGAITGQAVGTVWAKAVSVLDPYVMDSMLVEVVKVDSVVVRTKDNVQPQIYATQGQLQLVATVYPLKVNQQVVWSIKPLTGMATIDPTGLVTSTSGGNVWAKATSVQDPTKADSILINICSSDFSVKVYPNPVRDNLNINVTTPCGIDIYKAPATFICNYIYPPLIQVFNGTTGSLMYSQKIMQNNFMLPVGKLVPGVYYIQLNAALLQTRTRFIKK